MTPWPKSACVLAIALSFERIRQTVENQAFKGDEKKSTFHVALSTGVATFVRNAKTARELIVAAQKALQVALAKGGNCTEISQIVMEDPSS